MLRPLPSVLISSPCRLHGACKAVASSWLSTLYVAARSGMTAPAHTSRVEHGGLERSDTGQGMQHSEF